MLKTPLKDKINQHIGEEVLGEWLVIDQARVDRFADVTEDHQFIHVDPDKAKLTPFGGTIAHGFLILSLLTHMTKGVSLVPEGAFMGVSYGFDRVRFVSPVVVGSKIRARVTLTEVIEKNSAQLLFKQLVTVDVEGQDKPALVCDWLVMFVSG